VVPLPAARWIGRVEAFTLGRSRGGNPGGGSIMPIVDHKDVPVEPFSGGATYQTLVGDQEGTTPVRVGIQVSPPGYSTPTHSHPYLEVVTVIEGTGEVWIEGQEGIIKIGPGMTMVFQPDIPHWFRNTGEVPMKTYGVHSSPKRIVNVHSR
jgi:quercetin dioxygenase-like cupin family protein